MKRDEFLKRVESISKAFNDYNSKPQKDYINNHQDEICVLGGIKSRIDLMINQITNK
jgi:hypothetical protein